MAFVDKDMYLKRVAKAGRRNPNGKSNLRDWWMVRASQKSAIIPMDTHGGINIPLKYLGRKVKIKIEILE